MLGLVEKIKCASKRFNPLELLAISNKVAIWENIQLEDGPIVHLSPGTVRAGEYFQSILVSTPKCEDFVSVETENTEIEKLFFDDLPELYNDSSIKSTFHILFSDNSNDGLSQLQLSSLGTLQNFYHVRGRRDASFQRRYHEFLISPHNFILHELYSVSAQQVLDGLDALLNSTRIGLFEKYVNRQGELQSSFYQINHIPTIQEIEKLFNVNYLTGWSQQLIADLSLPIGGSTDFYDTPKRGLPDDDLPIKDKPFIEINGCYYAFNYYILADFFYRALQKCIAKRCKERNIKYEWDKKQAKATELEVEKIFSNLLPQAQTFRNCFYWLDREKGLSSETDLIVLYSDVLIVVEVKGRNRWHDAPIHKSRAIAQKNFLDISSAIEQTVRAEHYIKRLPTAKFYNLEWDELVSIPMTSNRTIFKIVVVLDGVNELTSCKDALEGVTGVLSEDVLCISIDDLLVYERYFEGKPILFLLYLKERIRATKLSRLQTFDELDHLAAYIGNINYVDFAIKYLKDSRTLLNPGSHDELNVFFAAIGNPNKNIEIPRPKYSQRLDSIFSFFDKKKPFDILRISSFLMKLPPFCVENLFNLVEQALLEIRLYHYPFFVNVIKYSKEKVVMIVVKEPDNDIGKEVLSYYEDAQRRMALDGVKSIKVLMFGYTGILNSISMKELNYD